MEYYAHRKEESGEFQLLQDHLRETAELARKFAAAFAADEQAYRCGMLHDIGKYSSEFQRRIKGDSIRVDHSTAGAVEALNAGDIFSAFCIAGHHGGLPDMGNKRLDTPEDPTFYGKIKRKGTGMLKDYSAFSGEVKVNDCKLPPQLLSDNYDCFFFIHMLFSCLTDADFLDTEKFMNGDLGRGGYAEIQELWEMLKRHVEPWKNAKNELNEKRNSILQSCMDAGAKKPGLFSLTVPTGGGKTVSSMAFALRHAVKNGLERVIYVIPYTSIIEQTQSVFEDIFGEENVVVHYANVDYDNAENDEKKDRRALAAENWDAPIILTTAVQFFESLYASKTSRCRKLHNIANSVIIFDEAQMISVPYLKPCVAAIAELVKNYGCSAVLCTATQPSLNRLFMELMSKEPTELCPDSAALYDYFRRVAYEYAGKLSDEELAERLGGEKQVLCVVNSRAQAQRIVTMLGGDAFHLSTTMTAYDRRRILDAIRSRLREGRECRVVSTSLIEAGVDVDFPTVYRAEAGLDSVIQAAGRCNREGRRAPEDSRVIVFETEQKPPKMLEQNISAARRALRRNSDCAAPDTVKEYFNFLFYTLKDEKARDIKEIMPRIESGDFEFSAIGREFRLIENSEYTLYIQQEDNEELLDRLYEYGPSRKLMRELGQYAVGVYPSHMEKLIAAGKVRQATENTYVLTDNSSYDKKFGLKLDTEELSGLAICI